MTTISTWWRKAHGTAESRWLLVRYYPQLGKATIAQEHTKRPDRGGFKRTLTLDKRDLVAHPEALRLLRRVAEEWLQEAEGSDGG